MIEIYQEILIDSLREILRERPLAGFGIITDKSLVIYRFTALQIPPSMFSLVMVG